MDVENPCVHAIFRRAGIYVYIRTPIKSCDLPRERYEYSGVLKDFASMGRLGKLRAEVLKVILTTGSRQA